ncbi:MAG: DNA polymerase III subunit beta [Planctomycetota bacterium]|nr:DNA polymerase III subunit beta [Planctomycetota bacterium]
MKVICDRGALVEALNLISGVVVARTPKPVLACVKLVAADGTLSISATDLEVSVRISTARVEVQTPGSALILADKLSQIVRESVDPTLTLTVEQDVAEIRGQDSRYKVFGYPVADYPPVPEFTGEPHFLATAGDLHKLISQTIFATARENSRYAINGVLLERQGNKLSVVATDGRRLAMAKGTCKAVKGDDALIAAIVPTKALNMILRVFSTPEQEVKVRLADNQIIFATDDAVLSSNLVEGSFPPYKDVIPRDGDKKATIAKDVLASAVRRAALLTNEESKGVRLAFSPQGVTLTSRAPEMGEAEVTAPLVSYVGEPIEIGFNPAFILDAMKVVDTEQVTIELKAANKPSVIRTGPDFLYVVMPVNLQ